MSKCGGGRGIGEVVGGDVNRLDGSDRTFLGRSDPLLQLAHFSGEVGLISHGAGHSSQQSGYLGSRLRKTEYVVDEQQRVRAFDIAEVFGYRKRGQRHAEARARRLRHLAIDQSSFRFFGIPGLDDARLGHFEPEIVAFAGALSDPAKDGESAVLLGDVVDEFHDDDSLADASAAEEANLSTFQKRLDEIDDLYSSLEHFRGRGLFIECGRGPVDGKPFGGGNGAEIIDRMANHIHHAAERAFADRHGDWSAQVNGIHAAHHAVSGLHSDAAHAALAEMLLHFQDNVDGHRHLKAVAYDAQRLINRWHGGFGELHVHRGSGDLDNVSDVFSHN